MPQVHRRGVVGRISPAFVHNCLQIICFTWHHTKALWIRVRSSHSLSIVLPHCKKSESSLLKQASDKFTQFDVLEFKQVQTVDM